MRAFAGRGQGGGLYLDRVNTKIGKPVLDIIKDKLPPTRIPDLANPAYISFDEYVEDPEPIPLDISK